MRYTTLMVRHGHAHRHLRKKKQRDKFDYLLFVFMVATPLFELPQAWDIYSNKSAANVSLSTWSFFAISNLAWITYALRNRLLSLAIPYVLYLIIEVAIVIGILLYR